MLDYREGSFKLLRSLGTDSKESIPAGICSLAGRYDNPVSTRCLARIDCSKIPAQLSAGILEQL